MFSPQICDGWSNDNQPRFSPFFSPHFGVFPGGRQKVPPKPGLDRSKPEKVRFSTLLPSPRPTDRERAKGLVNPSFVPVPVCDLYEVKNEHTVYQYISYNSY